MLTNIFQIIQLAEITSFTFRTNSYADSGIDFRSVQTDAQRGANQTADTIERVVRFGLETNPATMFLPESVKDRIVSAGIGLANGTVYLASAQQGVQDFITDRAIDALSYGAKQKR